MSFPSASSFIFYFFCVEIQLYGILLLRLWFLIKHFKQIRWIDLVKKKRENNSHKNAIILNDSSTCPQLFEAIIINFLLKIQEKWSFLKQLKHTLTKINDFENFLKFVKVKDKGQLGTCLIYQSPLSHTVESPPKLLEVDLTPFKKI